MTPTQKALIAIGVGFILIAVLWPWLAKLGLFRLPGDIRLEREGFSFYFPITTMILISAAISLIAFLLRWLGR